MRRNLSSPSWLKQLLSVKNREFLIKNAFRQLGEKSSTKRPCTTLCGTNDCLGRTTGVSRHSPTRSSHPLPLQSFESTTVAALPLRCWLAPTTIQVQNLPSGSLFRRAICACSTRHARLFGPRLRAKSRRSAGSPTWKQLDAPRLGIEPETSFAVTFVSPNTRRNVDQVGASVCLGSAR